MRPGRRARESLSGFCEYPVDGWTGFRSSRVGGGFLDLATLLREFLATWRVVTITIMGGLSRIDLIDSQCCDSFLFSGLRPTTVDVQY